MTAIKHEADAKQPHQRSPRVRQAAARAAIKALEANGEKPTPELLAAATGES